jgi:hypothetical protein
MPTLAERPLRNDPIGSLVGVPVVGPHSLRHLQCAVSVLAVEAGLGSESLARLQADCAGLVRDLFARSPEGALVLLRVLRQAGGVGLEVTAQYGATPEEPLGGKLIVKAWEAAG